ncbi:hypothetical protein FVER14953_20853 [Fusarium verticillioides]|nr:hypothetical protein FVER14953_20853 [Fusarium verticillioides]
MTDNLREASLSPQTLPSTSAASQDVASADSSTLSARQAKCLKSSPSHRSPEIKSIEPDTQHPAVEPTKAHLFADNLDVDRLPQSIFEFHLKKNTISADALVPVPLNIADFYRYREKIAEFVHKRFDYDPATQEITFRMPTPTHNKFARYVEEAILKELSKLNESHSNFVAGIKPSGNARIELEPLSLNAVSNLGSDTESKGQEKGPDVRF